MGDGRFDGDRAIELDRLGAQAHRDAMANSALKTPGDPYDGREMAGSGSSSGMIGGSGVANLYRPDPRQLIYEIIEHNRQQNMELEALANVLPLNINEISTAAANVLRSMLTQMRRRQMGV